MVFNLATVNDTEMYRLICSEHLFFVYLSKKYEGNEKIRLYSVHIGSLNLEKQSR